MKVKFNSQKTMGFQLSSISLKKVSKYENKFAKLQEKAAKFAFANQLKAK